MSILLHFIQCARTGAKRLVLECDGCSGQIFNQFVFAMFDTLVDATSELCRALGATHSRPIFERIDIFRGEVGHTFMVPDRLHGVIRRKVRTVQSIADIDEYEKLIRDCNQGPFKVTRIKIGDGIFRDMKKYVEQSHKLGSSHTDIDKNAIATRDRHWVNFGIGSSGGPQGTLSRHKYGAWRLHNGYDPSEVPCEIVVGRHTHPNHNSVEYVLLYENLGVFERQNRDFVKYKSETLCDGWRVEREIPAEKVRDTHKLVCLGMREEDKIGLWPCPDPTQRKLERCPESWVCVLVR